MWEFPSIQSFVANNGFIIFWTLGVLIFSAIAWGYVFYSIKYNTKESTGSFLKHTSIGAVTFLLVIFISWGTISRYNEASQCRNLDLTKVKTVRVKKLSNEESFSNTTILFTDSNKIQEGLKTLKNASGRKRQKGEQFFYGYELKLILAETGEENIKLYYFSENEKGQKTDIIIPHCSADSDEITTTEGIYASYSFGDWIRENIEPEFKKNQ